MMLFIVSEVMVFGAFFTAYFFIRVVNGDPWPAEGDHLPKLIAGFNTAILISLSLAFPDPLRAGSDPQGQPVRPPARDGRHVPARPDLPVHPDQRVRPHRLLAAGPRAGDDLLLADGPARRARDDRPNPARHGDGAGLPRPLLGRGAPRRRDPG